MDIFCTLSTLECGLKEGFAIRLSLAWGQLCHSHAAEALVPDSATSTLKTPLVAYSAESFDECLSD